VECPKPLERAVQHWAAFVSGQPCSGGVATGEVRAQPIFRRLNPAVHSQV